MFLAEWGIESGSAAFIENIACVASRRLSTDYTALAI